MNNSYKIFVAAVLFITSLSYVVNAQQILFDFDNAPLYSPFPITQAAGGITAYFTATGQGYSVQNANVMGFTPPGFSGRIIYPSSIYLSDIRIKFDHNLTEFSILYACQELGCDDAARMRVTAYRAGTYVGTNTRTATFPGTWPVDTLRCGFSAGFDSVIVHYDAPPPTCQDYGVIYMADNMRITPMNINGIVPVSESPKSYVLGQNYPNPFNPISKIKYNISKISYVKISVFDLTGREVEKLVDERQIAGEYEITFNGAGLSSGVYYYRMLAGDFTETKKLMLVK
ncbi:MAG: T9SS type A sorting domain-containing protein [Bacteroidetes bacterium]|nr:T9SS type A sorting domain-containing protein [Bacteroidota bacterium]